MNTQFNSNVIWLQLEYKISTLVDFLSLSKPWSNIFLQSLKGIPTRKNLAWGTKEQILKNFLLKNINTVLTIWLTRKISQKNGFSKKCPEMFLMPFHATGPLRVRRSKRVKKLHNRSDAKGQSLSCYLMI